MPPAGDNDALSHLVAISMPREGIPERLFTTNRWVTGETWYAATDVIAILDHFVVNLAYPSQALNQWLTAMLVLFRPQIEQLLIERDRAIAHWQAEHPGEDVFEDRRLEITSVAHISLREQIEWLDRLLDDTGAQTRAASDFMLGTALQILQTPATGQLVTSRRHVLSMPGRIALSLRS